ncbi:hypothetical protein IQ232_15815 [Microcystis aeruginosa LEGE 11464]|jgi:DNA-binding NarL/FixJ family response regulator|nr:hypothetical protein [Microcystis aeruginosa LEGE 11464]MCA2660115.1 hypothetical protein [Microcystis sp. M049S2]
MVLDFRSSMSVRNLEKWYKEEGKDEKARQIALKMLSAGFPVPEIARFTDLSPATIEQLQRQNAHDV